MNIDDVKKSFAGTARGFGKERHSIKSLSRRLLLSRQTISKMLRGGELEFEAQFENGSNGRTYEFASAKLDAMRESVVEEIINEICARLQGLDLPEHEMVLAALHGLRAQKADIETEFASKSSDDDDDDESDREVSRLIGGVIGGAAGGVLGGKVVGGLGGTVAGAAVGSAAGRAAGGSSYADDLAAAGIGAGLGYGGHRLVQQAGGYRAVGRAIVESPITRAVGTGASAVGAELLQGRMIQAIRRALAKAGKAAA